MRLVRPKTKISSIPASCVPINVGTQGCGAQSCVPINLGTWLQGPILFQLMWVHRVAEPNFVCIKFTELRGPTLFQLMWVHRVAGLKVVF